MFSRRGNVPSQNTRGLDLLLFPGPVVAESRLCGSGFPPPASISVFRWKTDPCLLLLSAL